MTSTSFFAHVNTGTQRTPTSGEHLEQVGYELGRQLPCGCRGAQPLAVRGEHQRRGVLQLGAAARKLRQAAHQLQQQRTARRRCLAAGCSTKTRLSSRSGIHHVGKTQARDRQQPTQTTTSLHDAIFLYMDFLIISLAALITRQLWIGQQPQSSSRCCMQTSNGANATCGWP